MTDDNTQVELDRRSVLEQSFDAADAGQPIEPVTRDADGRFTPRTPPVDAPAEPEQPPPVWKRPPASWKRDYHEVWSKADPKMQEYAWQREEQMRAGVEPLLSKAQFADAMQEAISPYLTTIQGLGLTPDKAVAALMKADDTLRNSNPQEKLQYFLQLAQSYGINLGAQAQAQPAGQPQPGQQQTVDPMIVQLQNELNRVRGEVMGWKQQQEMAENQTLLSEINKFSLSAEHFEDARPAMIQLLQSGLAQTLEEAYEKAIRLDENLFQSAQAAKQAATAKEQTRVARAARAAAVSVRSAAPGANTAPKSNDRRAILEEQFADLEARL